MLLRKNREGLSTLGSNMKIDVRRVATWGAWTLGVLAALVALYLSVFFLPYPLFPYHLEAEGFHLYSDQQIPTGFEEVLRESRTRLEAMELYRGEEPLRIFVCQSHDLFRFIVRMSGRRHAGQGLLISVAGNAFFSQEMIAEVGRRNRGRPVHTRLQGSWPAAIAHEQAHELVFAEVGFRSARRIPVWKSEGYADYQANKAAIDADADYDLRRRVGTLLDDGAWTSPTAFVDRRHFRWQLQVEFLCEVDGLDFNGLLRETVTDSQARERMILWYHEGVHEGP
jgi:hypothetical protein